MKHTKLVVVALLVALLACLSINAMAECDHVIDPAYPGIQVAAPTCITEGSMQYQCMKCGAIFYKAIPSLGGHVHSGIFVCLDPEDPDCLGKRWVEKCARDCGHYFTDTAYTANPKGQHDWVVVNEGNPATCTNTGIAKTEKCSKCGTVRGGGVTKALGHAPAINYTSEHWAAKRATCASEGKAVLLCTRPGCGAVLDSKTLPKLTYHVKVAGGVITPITEDEFECVWPMKPATCTADGSWGKYVCPTCGKADSRPQRNGGRIPATGHRMVIDDSLTVLPTCTTPGQTVMYCTNAPDLGNGPVKCGHYQVITAPAIGHSAVWTPTEATGAYTRYDLVCGKCGLVLATQIVGKGDKAPSTTVVVNTLKQETDKDYKAEAGGKLTETAKNGAPAKKTTKKTTTATAKAAPAPAAPAPAAVDAAAPAVEGAVELKEGIVVLNDAVAVLVKDGQVTLLNAAAEDETVAFYTAADADPIALVVGEAVEFVEGATVAIVKTADLPAATASK